MPKNNKKIFSSIFLSERKSLQKVYTYTDSKRKRKNNVDVLTRTISTEIIKKEVLELWKEFVECYQLEENKNFFHGKMKEEPVLFAMLKKRFDEFIKKYQIKPSQDNCSLISFNEEGTCILNSSEFWVIYIMVNKKRFTLFERLNLINNSLNYEIESNLMYNLFKYFNDTLNIKEKVYSNIPKQSTKYIEFINRYKYEKGDRKDNLRRNDNKIERALKNENVNKLVSKQSRERDMITEIIEEEEIKSEIENEEEFTFIPYLSPKRETIDKYKFILTPVRTSVKNVKSCERALNEIRRNKAPISCVKIKPNKHLAKTFNELNYKTEVLQEKFKEMIDKNENNFRLKDLIKIRNDQYHLNKEKHINISTFSLSNNKLLIRDEKDINLISSNFNGNNNFALFEVKNEKTNKVILTPLKMYKNLSERKIVETDLNKIYSNNELKDFVYQPYDTEISKLLFRSREVEEIKKTLFK